VKVKLPGTRIEDRILTAMRQWVTTGQLAERFNVRPAMLTRLRRKHRARLETRVEGFETQWRLRD
jgi:hypothetical protein